MFKLRVKKILEKKFNKKRMNILDYIEITNFSVIFLIR